MTEFTEAAKGFTDIPIALLALVIGILLIKKKEPAYMFFCIAFSAVLGAIVHSVSMPLLYVNLIWIFLYPLLYECIRRFAHVYISYIRKEKTKEKKPVLLIELLFILINDSVVFADTKYDILILMGFATIMIFRVAVCISKTKNVPKNAMILLVLLPLPVIMQTLEGIVPYAVVIEHILISADMIYAYFILKK